MPTPFNLSRYFSRIGYKGSAEPTLANLKRIHLAHTQTIPFENLDALLRRPIRLDSASVFEKLVVAGRGGWCFEQNGLFRDVMTAMGYEGVTDVGARVVMDKMPERAEDFPARTHRLLTVRIDGDAYLADVGFGGYTLDTPIRFVDGIVQKTERSAFSIERLPPAGGGRGGPEEGFMLRYHKGGPPFTCTGAFLQLAFC